MEYVFLAVGVALPWLLGCALLVARDWPRSIAGAARDERGNGGAAALRLGYGYFIGVLALTLWMRALSAAGVGFGRAAIGVPLLAGAAALLFWGVRRHRLTATGLRGAALALARPLLPRWERWAWALLLAWLALRVGMVAAEAAWRPLYPWEAWTQWATKARVWYELGRIAPFVRADAWLAGMPGVYFDAAPDRPATIPLLQVWNCVALGRWDDAAMNWPWPLMLLALTLAVYGALRAFGLSALAALVGAYLVASLPLLDTHAALAGYPDLMLSGVYTLAVIAFHRSVLRRDMRDALLALALALACPLIAPIGTIWMLTLIPGAIVVVSPRRGPRFVGAAFGLAALALVVLARTDLTLFGYDLHLDYRPPWRELADAYLLLGNWHLLWYALIALAVVGARRLTQPPLAPLAAIVAPGLAVILVAYSFTRAPAWIVDPGSINRTTLHLAPLLICVGLALWRELTVRAAPQSGTPAEVSSVLESGAAPIPAAIEADTPDGGRNP
jgi:hypothetical protein